MPYTQGFLIQNGVILIQIVSFLLKKFQNLQNFVKKYFFHLMLVKVKKVPKHVKSHFHCGKSDVLSKKHFHKLLKLLSCSSACRRIKACFEQRYGVKKLACKLSSHYRCCLVMVLFYWSRSL